MRKTAPKPRDAADTTGAAFLGLTLGCARCHNHKYDPISQREFYQFFAFLNNCDEPTLEVPSMLNLERGDSKLVFRVTDNGVGLPHEHRDRLTEPYVTTRAKGTGLGLAIVRKILEDHGGDLVLQDAGHDDPSRSDHHGAEVVLTFPLTQKSSKGTADEQARVADRV